MKNQMIDIEGSLISELAGPLHCWDVVSMNTYMLSMDGRRKQELFALNQFKELFGWDVSLESLLSNNYEALILTDSSTKIKWVNDGFSRMTGYHKQDVLGKSPKMLQGEKTSQESRIRVRKRLNDGKAFSERLVNYRKNGDEYLCDVDIHPLYGGDKELCHYLALEREAK